MEIAFLTATILLVLFALLGLYDGFYLHILKYKLYQHPESKPEHWMHTARAILFPGILYFLYLNHSKASFYVGLTFITLDMLVLALDAFLEKDSRQFMGDCPAGNTLFTCLSMGSILPRLPCLS